MVFLENLGVYKLCAFFRNIWEVFYIFSYYVIVTCVNSLPKPGPAAAIYCEDFFAQNEVSNELEIEEYEKNGKEEEEEGDAAINACIKQSSSSNLLGKWLQRLLFGAPKVLPEQFGAYSIGGEGFADDSREEKLNGTLDDDEREEEQLDGTLDDDGDLREEKPHGALDEIWE